MSLPVGRGSTGICFLPRMPLAVPTATFGARPTGRADEAEDAKRDVREELAEQRKALKELLDSGECVAARHLEYGLSALQHWLSQYQPSTDRMLHCRAGHALAAGVAVLVVCFGLCRPAKNNTPAKHSRHARNFQVSASTAPAPFRPRLQRKRSASGSARSDAKRRRRRRQRQRQRRLRLRRRGAPLSRRSRTGSSQWMQLAR